MILRIEHTIEYRYDRPVFIEPTTVRMRPKSDSTQTLIESSLTVTPEPGGRTEIVDHNGNDVVNLWFDGLHDRLRLHAVATVQTVRHDPFNYLITAPDVQTVPAQYPSEMIDSLMPYRLRREPSGAVDEFADALARGVDRQTVPFLSALAGAIEGRFSWITRTDGDPWTPGETLEKGEGACRDLAVFFMDACRSQGLACRFVSGYQYDPENNDDQQLHAWAEVYLPGAGWRGYDPGLGLATADAHVSIATAPEATDAAPTTGTFRGTGAKPHMSYQVQVSASDRLA